MKRQRTHLTDAEWRIWEATEGKRKRDPFPPRDDIDAIEEEVAADLLAEDLQTPTNFA